MKRLQLLLIFIFNTCIVSGQARIAFLEKNQNDYILNSAIICDVMIKLKGFEWYDTHILNVENKRTINTNFEVSYNGKIKFYSKDTTNTELYKVFLEVIEYMESHHVILYIYDIDYIKLIKQPRLQDRHIKWDLVKVINSRKQYYSNLIDVHNPLILFTKRGYEIYVELERKRKKVPLSCRKWIESEISKLINIPIKSSIDYGITNDDFLLNENRIKP